MLGMIRIIAIINEIATITVRGTIDNLMNLLIVVNSS
jgi:hypothetical protein